MDKARLEWTGYPAQEPGLYGSWHDTQGEKEKSKKCRWKRPLASRKKEDLLSSPLRGPCVTDSHLF